MYLWNQKNAKTVAFNSRLRTELLRNTGRDDVFVLPHVGSKVGGEKLDPIRVSQNFPVLIVFGQRFVKLKNVGCGRGPRTLRAMGTWRLVPKLPGNKEMRSLNWLKPVSRKQKSLEGLAYLKLRLVRSCWVRAGFANFVEI